MEHTFETNLISCLDMAVQEIQNSEQTQQINLPDSMPDVGTILAAWGQVILRGKEWRGSGISVSGGVMAWVLYAPEDGGQAQSIDVWIPFQMKWELPADIPEGSIRIQCLLRFVDARSISARKILARAGIGVMAMVCTPKTVQYAVPNQPIPGVEMLRSTYPVRLMKEAGEKNFFQDEALSLPESAPLPEKLIYYRLDPVLLDKKVLSDKIVFRGVSHLHALYRSEEGQLHAWNFEASFSQYAPLNGEYGTDAQGDILLSPTSVELELNDEGHFHLKCGIVAQYLITDRQLLELIQDAYSPGRELRIQKEELDLPGILETRQETIYGEQTIAGETDLVVDVCFLPDFPRQIRQEDRVDLEMPGLFQVLYYGEGRGLHSASAHWEGSQSWNADAAGELIAVPQSAQSQGIPGSGSILAKTEYPISLTTLSGQGIPMVTGVEMGEQIKPDPNRPSLILRRAGSQLLWEIAKETGSTVEAIRTANGLKEEPAAGQMLLIPVP